MKWEAIHETLRYDEVEAALGIKITQKTASGEHIAHCPLSTHGGVDRNPSFSLNIRRGLYQCFSCEGKGRTPELVRDIFGFSQGDALEWLSQFSDASSMDDKSFLQELDRIIEREKDAAPPKAVLPWFSSSVLPDPEPTEYFAQRRISPVVVDLLGLRYVPDWSRYSYQGPCIIIPHYFGRELRGWQERWLDFENAPDFVRKYTNSDDLPRKETLYNWDNVNRVEVILVESCLTAATLLSFGYPAVASFGATVSNDQMRLLSSCGRVYVSYDNDEAGQKAAHNLAKALEYRTDVWFVKPPSGDKADLGDCEKGEIDQLISEAQLYSISAY